MVLALCSGSTTRFEMGDDYAFTANMSLPTTEDPEETTWRIYDLQAHIRATNSFRPVYYSRISLCFYPKITRSRWREMDEIAVTGSRFLCLNCRTRLEVCLRYLHVLRCLDL